MGGGGVWLSDGHAAQAAVEAMKMTVEAWMLYEYSLKVTMHTEVPDSGSRGRKTNLSN